MHWLREKRCPGEALWVIRWSVPCSMAVLLIPPFYPKFFLSSNRTPTRFPAQSISTQSEKLHEGAAGIRTMCVQATPDHLKGPSPAASSNAALRLLSFCASTRCPLRRAINHNYNSAWQSLILPLWGSVHSSPPSRPLPLPLLFRRSMLLSRLLFIWPLCHKHSLRAWTFSTGVHRWRWRVLSPTPQITAARPYKRIFVFGCWIRHRKKKADDKTQSRQWFKWQRWQSQIQTVKGFQKEKWFSAVNSRLTFNVVKAT